MFLWGNFAGMMRRLCISCDAKCPFTPKYACAVGGSHKPARSVERKKSESRRKSNSFPSVDRSDALTIEL